MDSSSVPNRELYGETLRCLNNLAQYRRMRIFAGNNTVPSVIWLVLLVGGIFAVSYTFFFGMKNIEAQYLLTTTLTVMISSILFLIFVLDHPFTGTSRVSLEPLTEAMAAVEGDSAESENFISPHVLFSSQIPRLECEFSARAALWSPKYEFYLFLLLRVGFPLRFVFAIRRSSLSLIDFAIWRDAPLSDDLERLPRFAASAAPAAICCFFDFAGIQNDFAPNEHFGFMK